MRSGKEQLNTIGEVARRSGVSVKTIRHYSDIGVLPPSEITEAGYRLYSESDRSRLELIRTLRASGFDLPTIRRLLEGEGEASETLRLQLNALDLQLRTLRRRRKVLESALEESGEDARASYPDRARALGLLEARERQAFLAEHLEKSLEGVPVDQNAKAWFWQSIVSGMPEELDDKQLEAWTELAELASDESFIEALREQTKPVWEAAERNLDPAGWNDAVKVALDEGVRAMREGDPPTGERGQHVVVGWIKASARAVGKRDDPRFAKWMLSHHERTYDPRMERYWELMATLKRWEYDPTVAKAYQWLIEGLRWQVSRSQPADGDGR